HRATFLPARSAATASTTTIACYGFDSSTVLHSSATQRAHPLCTWRFRAGQSRHEPSGTYLCNTSTFRGFSVRLSDYMNLISIRFELRSDADGRPDNRLAGLETCGSCTGSVLRAR